MDETELKIVPKKKPLHVDVYEKLYQQINERAFASGRLPSEPKLAESLGVSRMTLRKALALLRDDGIIINIQGKGNFIAKQPNTIANSGLEKLGHPIYKCCTKKLDGFEYDSYIEFPTAYVQKILEQPTSAAINFQRWYKSGEEYCAYSLSFIAIETINLLRIDTSTQEPLAEFLETKVYDLARRSMLEIQLSESGDFVTNKHPVSDDKHMVLVIERLYGECAHPLVVTKHYLQRDMCSITVNSKPTF